MARLSKSGITAAKAWVEEGKLFVELSGDDRPAVTLHAFRRGTQTSLVEQARIGWAYLAASRSDGTSAGESAAQCRRVAQILEPCGDDIIALLNAPVVPIIVPVPSLAVVPVSPDVHRAIVVQDSVFDGLRRGPYVDYPSCVNIETLAACPARCTFCTYPTLERRGTRMSDALLSKVLTELEDIPRSVPFVLYPFLLSEPFAERRLDDILERAQRRLPNASIDLITTGALLDADRLAKLARRTNVRELCISLNFVDAAEYEAEIGLSWERTWRNVRALHRAMMSGEVGFRVTASRVATADEGDERFREFVERELPGVEVRIYDRHDWLGKIPAPRRDLDRLPCTQWFELKVAATGQVALCCQDSHVEHSLGDVATTPLLEIYNQPFARSRRQSLTARSKFDACRGCGFSNGAGETEDALPSWFPVGSA